MKSIFTTTVLFLFLTLNLFAQASIVQESFESLGSVITPLPYYRYKAGTPPVRAYYFPIASINSEVAQKVWADVQLTQPIPNEHEMESLKFRFNPTNGNYWIGVVRRRGSS